VSDTWEAYETTIGVEKLLPLDKYEIEVIGANPMFKDGITGRAIFLDLVVQSGLEQGSSATVYVFVPEPGNRKAGNWYVQKMKGFGDLKPVYAIMPQDDLQGALNILCAALIGRKVWAQIGPGNGEFSNKNSIYESWPIDDAQEPVAAPTPEQIKAVEDSYTKRDEENAPLTDVVTITAADIVTISPADVDPIVTENPAVEPEPEETETVPEPKF